jgi:type II secretory pathway component PulF
MKLAYTAYDGGGKTASGVIEADDAMAAAEVLRRKDCTSPRWLSRRPV